MSEDDGLISASRMWDAAVQSGDQLAGLLVSVPRVFAAIDHATEQWNRVSLDVVCGLLGALGVPGQSATLLRETIDCWWSKLPPTHDDHEYLSSVKTVSEVDSFTTWEISPSGARPSGRNAACLLFVYPSMTQNNVIAMLLVSSESAEEAASIRNDAGRKLAERAKESSIPCLMNDFSLLHKPLLAGSREVPGSPRARVSHLGLRGWLIQSYRLNIEALWDQLGPLSTGYNVGSWLEAIASIDDCCNTIGGMGQSHESRSAKLFEVDRSGSLSKPKRLIASQVIEQREVVRELDEALSPAPAVMAMLELNINRVQRLDSAMVRSGLYEIDESGREYVLTKRRDADISLKKYASLTDLHSARLDQLEKQLGVHSTGVDATVTALVAAIGVVIALFQVSQFFKRAYMLTALVGLLLFAGLLTFVGMNSGFRKWIVFGWVLFLVVLVATLITWLFIGLPDLGALS